MQQMANHIDESKSCYLVSSVLTMGPNSFVQGTNYERALTNGYPHRTPQRTTMLLVVLITRKQQRGSSEAGSIRSGSQQVPYFGYMENV